MERPNAKKRHVGAARTFMEGRLAVGVVAFGLDELVREVGLSRIAARRQLARLGPAVARIGQQPFFLIVSPEHRHYSCPPIDWWIGDYFRWLRQPYYLALFSAAAAHGSSPQAVQVTHVMTAVPRRPLKVGKVRLIFFVKRRIAQTKTQDMSNAHAPTRVSTPAATAFDLIRYSGRIGGLGRAAETIRPLLPKITAADLRQVLDAEDEIPTAQRLGFIFEKIGMQTMANVVERWLPRVRRVILLADYAVGSEEHPVSQRWRVRDNSGEFS